MRTLIVLTALASLAAGCSSSRCSVTQNADGTATLTCDDGTTATIRNGTNGTPGTPGTDGAPGTDGTNGTNGTSCTVADQPDGTRLISCSDGTQAIVTNGTAGRNAFLTGPGLRVEVRASGVDATSFPYVELRFTDTAGRPLDRTGTFTVGAITARFTVAHLPTEARTGYTAVLPFVNYLTQTVTGAAGSGTQPVTDSTGTWTDVDALDGIYRYTFSTALPAGYPATETHRIGLYATRTFDTVRYVANATSTFRPDGMAVTTTRDIVATAACNGCHSPLAVHGGAREDVDLCVTCHGQGYTDPDTGASIDFENMIHRIHRGEHLPSVEGGTPYQIVGFGGRVHDYSTVVFPQDIRNCTTCHQGPDAALATTEPNRAACGSCHDNVYFGTGAPAAGLIAHPGGPQADDTNCASCHQPSGGLAPILDSHFTLAERASAAQPQVTIDAATLTAARTLQVDFTVTVNGAPRDILTAPLTSLSAIVAGPTTDYLFNASFTLTTATAGTLTAIDAAAGRFSWTSAATVDTIAATASADPIRSVAGVTITTEGTWAVGLQATVRVNGTATATSCATAAACTTALGPAPEGMSWGCVATFCTPQALYAARNRIAYVALTDPTPVPRRQVVDVDRCNGCHQQLRLHGGGRNNPELCVMCHNSTFDTIDRMPVPAGGTAETMPLSFGHFIHRVHTGEHGVSPATFWGPAPNPRPTPGTGGTPVSFAELRFPADRRVCDRCHMDPPAGIELSPMLTLRAPRSRLITDTRTTVATYLSGAIASACTGCHDSPAAQTHADAMTTSSGAESCTTCHEAGGAFGIDGVHARPEYDLR